MIKRDRDVIQKRFEMAKQQFAAYGVNVDAAIEKFKTIPISIHNWLDDDVVGFEDVEGLHNENVVTGNYPGKARNGDDMRQDLEMVIQCCPAKPKLNLHTLYAEPATKKSRNELDTEDFRKWIDWAKTHSCGIDMNVSYFTHPNMKNGLSLSSPDKDIRNFWVECGIGSRKISADIGKELGVVCVNNLWIPDGMKDTPVDRFAFRRNLIESLDRIYEAKYDKTYTRDVMEGKVFGIGIEAFTTGSHDFYLGYAASHGLGVCFDTGHYLPTETIIDKLSSVHPFVDCIQLHLSRGIRWDSDHTLTLSDELIDIMHEMRRGELYDKNVYIGLDFFDATINRVAEWIIGMRSAGKALLTALLEPTDMLMKAERDTDFTLRLSLLEEFKNLPYTDVWDYVCASSDSGVGTEWIDTLKKYEADVLLKR
jgi:L-rhamnose isomerase